MPIAPRTPPGTLELLPRRQAAFQRMLDTIRQVYELFGFHPIETPAFELTDVLLSKSGGETEKQVYFVQSTGALQQGHAPDLALRFDLTVPLARYVAEHERDLPFPFRRYQIQRVYRGERAQKGRFREFYQCDIDVIGKDTLPVVHDAEMPAVIHQVFTRLGVGAFRINLSNRKIMQGLLRSLGVDDPVRRTAVLRQVDRLDKVDRATVRGALLQPPTEDGGGPGLDADGADRILDLAQVGGDAAEVLAFLEGLSVAEPTFLEGVSDLRHVAEALGALGVPEEVWRINLGIARGLDYYTGTVYETFLTDQPGTGSVCSGGRYDDLAGQYTRSRLPGVGISIGATRLFAVLSDAGVFQDGPGVVEALVVPLDPSLLPDGLALATAIRGAGVRTEVTLEQGKVAKHFKYADKAGIRFALLLGADEKAAGQVTVKDLATGAQDAVGLAAAPGWLAARSGAL